MSPKIFIKMYFADTNTYNSYVLGTKDGSNLVLNLTGGGVLDDSLFTAISADVASWINDRNSVWGTDYNCVSEIISDGKANSNLVGQYTTEFSPNPEYFGSETYWKYI